MNRDKTIALWLRCQKKGQEARSAAYDNGEGPEAGIVGQFAAQEEWNRWAIPLLNEKKASEAKGQWEIDRPAWSEKAIADFSAVRFVAKGYKCRQFSSGPVSSKRVIEADGMKFQLYEVHADGNSINFYGFIFPSGALFDSAEFPATKYSARALFDGAEIHGNCVFRNAIFRAEASFTNVQFKRTALFSGARFESNTSFTNAYFEGDADFGGAKLTQKKCKISFHGAFFKQTADFENFECTGSATFFQSTFQEFANFKDAHFGNHTDFTAVRAGRGFNLTGAWFTQIPKFNQADFRQAPDLDGAEWPLPHFFAKGNVEDVSKYRALKRISIQGHDYQREHMAFKGELRSRRLTEDSWRSAGFWFGGLYDLVSDCGASVWRPFAAWMASILIFAAYYLWVSASGVACSSCVKASGNPVLESFYLSLMNGLVIFARNRDSRLTQAYQCLYGGEGDQIEIPASVTFMETLVQAPLSTVLLFLFLLAMRNRFRIK